MAARSWSASAGSNTTVAGINIGPGCDRANVDDGLRGIMAELAPIIPAIPISVKEHGATGDGATDDTLAVVAALAAGKDVYFPQGTYLVSAAIVTTAGQRLFGTGPNSMIRSTDSAQHLFEVRAEGVQFNNLRLEGAATSATNTAFAIYTSSSYSAARLRIEKCIFSGASAGSGFNNAIKLDTGADYSSVRDCHFERLWGTASGYGYAILCGPVTALLIDGNTGIGAANRGRHFVYLSGGASRCKVVNNYCALFNFDTITIYATDGQTTCDSNIVAHNTLVSPCVSGTISQGGISLSQNVQNTIVAHNVITGSGGCGILGDGTGSTKFKNNHFIGNVVADSQFVGIDLKALQGGTVECNEVRESSRTSAGTHPNIRLISDATTATSNVLVHGNRSTGTSFARSAFQLNSTAPAPTGISLKGNYFPTCNSASIELNSVQCEIDGWIWASSTWDIPNTADGAAATQTGITVTGALAGEVVAVSHSSLGAGWLLSGAVTGANTVAATVLNKTGGAVDPASGTLLIRVKKETY